MLFTMHISYSVDDEDKDLVMKKLKEYSLGYAAQNVAGELTDMSIDERMIEFEFGDKEMKMIVDTFGVDLEEVEQEQIEMAMRESYIIFFDSPVTNDNKDVYIDDIEATVKIVNTSD